MDDERIMDRGPEQLGQRGGDVVTGSGTGWGPCTYSLYCSILMFCGFGNHRAPSFLVRRAAAKDAEAS